jgi:glycogen(starch) synthase
MTHPVAPCVGCVTRAWYTTVARLEVVTRILAITNMYPPHHLGGYELACLDAVTRWRSRGHDVSVLTSDIRFDPARTVDAGDAIRRLQLYWRDGRIVSPSLRERLSIERGNLHVLRETLDEVRPDVVSVWHMGAVSLGLLTEITQRDLPMVFVLGDQWLVYGAQVDAWTRMFDRVPWARAVGRVSGVHTTVELGAHTAACFASEWLRDVVEQHSPLRLPARRVTVYGGIAHEEFTPGPRRAFARRLLYAGRVEERKGVHVAIEAMGHLPDDATLDVVGSWDDETYVERLREHASALGVGARITWHGQVPRDAVARAYREADVFLFPVVWEEPFGMAPLEAMASGTAVVATGTGGSAEFLIDGVNCLRVTPGDAGGLADAVDRLADDGLRERLVRAGLATAAYFDDDVYSRELEAWHVAAAARFESGEPDPRAPLAETLAALPLDEEPTANS